MHAGRPPILRSRNYYISFVRNVIDLIGAKFQCLFWKVRRDEIHSLTVPVSHLGGEGPDVVLVQ